MTDPVQSLTRVRTVIERGITDGQHLGGQLYVSLHGATVVDWAVGQARTGVPIRTDTVMLWLSSAKPVTAVAIGQLWEQERLDLHDSVAKWIHEFDGQDKNLVTIEHLLTHTGGLRTADKCDSGSAWEEIIECVCATPLEQHWIPGKRAGYHPSGSWYLLGEIVRRIDGRPFDQYVREEILAPCGMEDSWLALPPDQFRQYGDRLALMYHTDKGAPVPHRRWNTETDAAVCRPGRNGRGPTRELGRFYEHLLQQRQGAGMENGTRPILRPETVQSLTQRSRSGMFDDTFQQVIDWGLGFAIDSKRYGREMVSYGFGRHASDETFGHGGAQSSCAFADPAHGLVVAWAFNGLPGERPHQHRAHDLNSAIYEDLNLSGHHSSYSRRSL